MTLNLPSTQLAVQWYPPSYDVRAEQVPVPTIEHPDDAIIKIKLAGLCGSDLHVYRGHEDVEETHICGHEFVGEVVTLGASFQSASPASRPTAYSTLKVGDKVVSPFTTSCGECQFCRLGFTARCVHSELLGTSTLPGAQAQFIRIPHAGGTLLPISPGSPLEALPDQALLLLADILPTGHFVALQALTHPKLSPIFNGKPWPHGAGAVFGPVLEIQDAPAPLTDEDRILCIAVVGLGPVGLCATLALLDLLVSAGIRFRVIAVDPNDARRKKMQEVYDSLPPDARGAQDSQFVVADIEESKAVVNGWGRKGCHAVLEVVGNPAALTLSLDLLAPSGVISSCGVHQAPPLPFTGRTMYNYNVSLEFGRCSVRAVLGAAAGLLLRRRDAFEGLVERVLPLSHAPEAYARFEKGEWGKVAFDPWA
ncbi:hypothetical protein FA95DRAFT_1555324 [Auriscalpium vulgare]|uniref:Uncharacterized protein n=1 Tax=Auriscalpium vulgare TaxID=40419 RepID=A0ACB8S3U8_9AGAM|nr:hypothetical protein FA95DRAFT_1555324 [Auriscalpium vulgare]